MIERPVADIRDDLDKARTERERIKARIGALEEELDRAAAQQAPPHALDGKKVQRRVRSWLGGAWRTQRGIMTQNLYPASLWVGRGRFGTLVCAGGYYVRTLSGRGAYNVVVDAHTTAWEEDV